MERDKARKLIYLWSSTFEELKALSEATGKPMTALMEEAVQVIKERYPQVSRTLKESL